MATTKKQIRANRRNARKGGPRTAEGKAASCQNARTHGVFSSFFTEQEMEELSELYGGFAEELRPQGHAEEALLERLAITCLGMRRCLRGENALFARASAEGGEGWYVRAYERAMDTFGRYDTTLTNRFLRLLHEVEELQAGRLRERMTPPFCRHRRPCPDRPPDGKRGVSQNEPILSQAVVEQRDATQNGPRFSAALRGALPSRTYLEKSQR
jgi:hypothetical protein